MKLQLIHIAALIAIFQCLFLSLFFFTNKKGDSSSNKIFASLLFIFAIYAGYSFTQSVGVDEYFYKYFLKLYIISQVSFLISPLLYLYVKSLLIPNLKLEKKDIIHALLFLLAVGFLLLLPVVLKNARISFRSLNLIYGTILLLQDAFYIALIFITLKKYSIRIKDLISPGSSKISWLRIFVVGFILVWSVQLQGFIAFNVEELWKFCPYTESLYFLVIFLFLNTIIFMVLKKPELFSTIKRYGSSELNPDDKAGYLAKLKSAMDVEKLYLDPKLTLPLLSQKLSIPIGHLSQIINEEFNKNFNDFINCYRIKESKKLFAECTNGEKGILEIAYSVGFNSKSSFYNAFKKATVVTPKQYKINISKQ